MCLLTQICIQLRKLYCAGGSLALDSLAHHPRVGEALAESSQRPGSLMPTRLPFLTASVSGSVFLHVLLIFHSGIVN